MMKKILILSLVLISFGMKNVANAQKVLKKIAGDVCDCTDALVKEKGKEELAGVDELMEQCLVKSVGKYEKDLRKEYGDDFFENPSEDAMYDLGISVGKILISDCPIFLDLIVAESEEGGSSAADFYARGDEYYNDGNYKEAILQYNKAIKEEPDNPEYFNSRGVAYYESGRYYYAISDFINAIRLKSNYAMAYYNLAHSKYNLGDYDAALEDVKTSILYNPDYCSAHNLRGLAYNQLEHADSAAMAFQSASECDPDAPLYYYNMGYMAYTGQDYETANQHFSEAVNKGYESADVYSYLGNSLDQLEKYDAAVEAHTKYIAAFEDDYIGFYNRGLSYYHAGEYKTAIADFQASAKLDDTDPDIFLKLAQCYDALEMKEEAQTNYDKCIDMNPENAEYFDARAAFHAKNENYQQAIADSKRSLELYPNDCKVHMLMSSWYLELGDAANAEAEKSKGLEMGCEE